LSFGGSEVAEEPHLGERELPLGGRVLNVHHGYEAF